MAGNDTTASQESSHGGLPDTERMLAWAKAFDQLLHSDIPEYKFRQTMEKAKELSVYLEFQQAVRELRKRWIINPTLPGEVIPDVHHPDSRIGAVIFDSAPPDGRWDGFQVDMKRSLFAPFGLDEQCDSGLVVAAIFFGLTYENLVDNWEAIKLTAAIESSPGVSITVYDSDQETRKKPGVLLAVAYFVPCQSL